MPPTVRFPYITGETCCLHPPETKEGFQFIAYVANQSRNNFPFTIKSPARPPRFQSWAEEDYTTVLIGYETTDPDEPLGERFGFMAVDAEPADGRASIHGALDYRHRGNGYHFEGFKMCVDYAFEAYPIERVFAHVYEHNRATKRMHERIGLEETGRIPNHKFVEGEYKDIIHYETTREEWAEMED